ncbi:MAG: YggS family pyridoxal phosphate-dependent enzyme [Pseudobdellovibrionaceae bacterium]|jgi:pyridoxal phosphate enzyme (YggS family)|nr:YggS family pyridoxal phosphate-dependent enzyme [Pseudobdellovibrionaceae bacterium]
MSVSQNLNRLREKIEAACLLSGRSSYEVTLVAVSKFQNDEKIQEALDFGQRVFGENRVQEALQHWQARRALFPDLELHLIGPLQRNKVKQAVALFDVIETIDRPALIDDLVREMREQNKSLRYFVQVNIGQEDQKSGVEVSELETLLSYAAQAGLTISGLMCIPPVNIDPTPFFSKLRSLCELHKFSHLSMGMSADYEKAIAHGATHIRIGSLLFGSR